MLILRMTLPSLLHISFRHGWKPTEDFLQTKAQEAVHESKCSSPGFLRCGEQPVNGREPTR